MGTTHEHAAEIDELVAIVGSANVLTGDDASPQLVDWRNVHHGTAVAVVRPGSSEEVAAVVRWCAANDVVVVTQGGNTGLSGGQIPMNAKPTVVLSLARMNQIVEVDAEGWTMTVQSGVTIEAMQEAAAAGQRLFAPDWGARGTATIGGAIATDAGGNNVVRYGNTRDQILGLEVVLADGEIWDGLRALRKDSSGYDIKHLFVGSEGTLGVVTQAVVKLHPATPFQQTAMVSLSRLDKLMELFALANEVVPDAVLAFELMPEVAVARACELFEITHPMQVRSEFYVLVRLAAAQSVTERLGAFLEQGAEAGLISDAVVASTAEQEQRLWKIREEMPAKSLWPQYNTHGLKMDTAVPIARMGEYHNAVCAIAEELVPGALSYGFGHVGDGNCHMAVLPISDDQVEPFLAVKAELNRRIDEMSFALGATLSAEHGVGRELRHRVAGQKPDVEWKMMHAVKAALDPDGRFNPGVLLPDG